MTSGAQVMASSLSRYMIARYELQDYARKLYREKSYQMHFVKCQTDLWCSNYYQFSCLFSVSLSRNQLLCFIQPWWCTPWQISNPKPSTTCYHFRLRACPQLLCIYDSVHALFTTSAKVPSTYLVWWRSLQHTITSASSNRGLMRTRASEYHKEKA